MTPEEAVKKLVDEGLLKWRGSRTFTLKLFGAVVATAKVEETRRCVNLVEALMEIWWCDTVFYGVLSALRHDIRRTGGPEVKQ